MKRLLIALAASAAFVSPAIADTVAITGGKLVIGDGSTPIEDGIVVVRDGKVIAAGANGSVAIPDGAEIIVARGKWVTPGLVAAYSQVGLAEVDLGVDGADDTSASKSPHSAAIDISYSVNPMASTVAVNRADGITRVMAAPSGGRNIFAGQGAVIDLGADLDPITKARAFQVVSLGESGANRAGGSRSAAYLQLKDALDAANGKPQPTGDRIDDALLTDADIAALKPVVSGQTVMLVNVSRAIDIVNVLALKRDYPKLKIVLLGAAEGWLVADQIAAAGVPVIADPIIDLPSSFEQLAATQSNIGRMRAAGVTVAATNLSDFTSRNAFNQRQYAGNLVALNKVPGAAGVSWDEAFAMVSSRAAEAYGMGGEIGVLKAGAHGDVVVWDGDPLEGSSAVEMVWIDGVRQSIETRQTKLRDRYKDLSRRSLPGAYRR